MADQHDMDTGATFARVVRLGERQAHGPLAVFPLFLERHGGDVGRPRYITLREALSEGLAAITEVDEGGSVPELRVVNKGDSRILVLDGEELRGAKQNRVLNTSVLIDKHATLVVPVACTERGRWSYATREFAESEIVAERRVRHAMRRDTQAALVAGRGHLADQGAVWREVDDLHVRQSTSSPTSAMRDAYRHKKSDLDAVIAAFPVLDGQKGMLVLHGGHVVGLDLVSRGAQYAELHIKLLRSYAFEALVSDGEPGDEDAATAFLERVAALPGRRFKSPGLGWDVRFQGTGVLGSALVYRGHTVHAAFFDVGGASGTTGDEAGEAGGSAAASARVAHRGRPRARPAARGTLRGGPMDTDERERAYRAAAEITRGQLRRDAPERARVLDEVQKSDVVVVAGIYDHVEAVLQALAVPHSVVSTAEVERLRLRPEQLLVVNCPGQLSAPAVRRVRAFVEAGGSLFTTDWALKHVVEPAFPGVLAFRAAPTRDDVVRIEVADADNIYLQGVLEGQRRPAVVARGVVVPHHRPRPRARAGAHHQPRARREVRGDAGGGVVPLGRGRRLPHDQSLLPATHRAAQRPAPERGREPTSTRKASRWTRPWRPSTRSCLWPRSSRPNRRRRSWPTSSSRRSARSGPGARDPAAADARRAGRRTA